MTDKIDRLLLALREIEEQNLRLSREDFLQRLHTKTSHKPTTLKTYMTKNLGGVLVHEEPGSGNLFVRHALRIDEDQFAVLMSQNNLLKEAAQNRTRWLQITKAVADVGALMGFTAGEDPATP